MFNRSFNVLDFIEEIPSRGVKVALYGTLRDSLNFRLVNAANTVCEAIEAEGFDIKEFGVEDAEKFLCGADLGDDEVLRELRALMSLRNLLEKMANHNVIDLGHSSNNLRDRIGKDKDRPAYGTLAHAIEQQCGVQQVRVRRNADAEAALEAVGVKTTDEDRMNDALKARDTFQHFANQKAARKGAIEWMLDAVLAADGKDTFADLPVALREELTEKVNAKFPQLIEQAASNTRNGRKGLGLGDIIVMRDETVRLKNEAYKVEAPKPADGPTPGKAKRVRKPNAKPATAEQLKALVEHAAH